jgi:hypothetical protein
MANGDELRPIATEVLFEDEEVRVWNQIITAGETLGRHRHDNDYALITVRGSGTLRVEFHAGSGGALGERIDLHPKRGEIFFVEKGHEETAHNDGEEYRAILVELKRES